MDYFYDVSLKQFVDASGSARTLRRLEFMRAEDLEMAITLQENGAAYTPDGAALLTFGIKATPGESATTLALIEPADFTLAAGVYTGTIVLNSEALSDLLSTDLSQILYAQISITDDSRTLKSTVIPVTMSNDIVRGDEVLGGMLPDPNAYVLARITNANVNAAIETSPATTRTALRLGSGKTLYVDSVNGNDSTGSRQTANPFLTLAAAKTAAVSGDTIVVYPGTYTIATTMLKNGVNWHGIDATVESTVADGSALLDDSSTGANGAVTCRITGNFKLKRATVIKLVNTDSDVVIECDTMEYLAGGTTVAPGVDCLVYHIRGRLEITANLISAPTTIGIYWENGPHHTKVSTLESGIYPIYAFAVEAMTGDMFVTAQLIDCLVEEKAITIGDSAAFNPVVWVNAQLIRATGGGILEATGGKMYIQALKLQAGGDLASITGGKHYITTQKIEGRAFGVSGGELWIEADQWEDNGLSGDVLTVSGGTAWVKGGTMNKTVAGDGITVSGGALQVTDLRIDTSISNTSNPIVKSGGTLTLGGCYLFAEASRDSIAAATAQDVQVYGGVFASKAVNVNVTLVGGTFTVGTEKNRGTNTGDQDLSSYATLTGTETLTNKTLTSPILTTPTLGAALATSIGIGATPSAELIEIKAGDNAGFTGITALAFWSTNTSYTTKSRIASNFDITYITQNARYNGGAWVADNTGKPTAGIQLVTISSGDGHLDFYTSNTNNAGQGTLNLRLDKDGNLLVGNTSGTEKIDVTGNIKASGNLISGGKLVCTSSARCGTATLVAGTVTVTSTGTTANTVVLLTRKTAGGTIGDLTWTVSAGASFTINSALATDTSTVAYLLIETA